MSREVAMKEEWDRASPYFRHYVACPPSYAAVAAYTEATRRGLPPPLFYDAPRHARAAKGALAELARGALAEQAAVAAEASGSSVAGAAEEPLLSDAPLPKTRKRVRAEVSEKTDPLEWHCIGKRQKTESSAVADEESSAVAGGVLRSGGPVVGKGRSPSWWRASGGEQWGCMFLGERREDEDEEESSQATTLQFGSPAKGRYVCLDGDDCEDFDCPCDQDDEEMKRLQREADEEETREYKSLHAKVGKGKGRSGGGRSGGRAAPKKDRKANNKEKGKEAEPCICENCMSQETYDLYIKEKEKAKEPKYGTAAYLAWIAHKANKDKEEARSELFAELQEEGRQLRLEREGKGKEKGNDKETGKHLEELKSEVKKARDTVKETKSRLAEANGVVKATKQAYLACKAKGQGSEKGNAAVAAATFLGDGPEPVWPIEARARMVDIPLNERRGARVVIGPPRTPEEWHSELGWRDEHGRSRSWGDERKGTHGLGCDTFPQHVLEPGWRSWTDTDTDSSTSTDSD